MNRYWDVLPDEISMSIFYMFPYREQYILGSVCKKWYSLIRVGSINELQATQLTAIYIKLGPVINVNLARVFAELATFGHRSTFMTDPIICRLIREECYELMDQIDALDDAICRLYRVLDGRSRPPRKFINWAAQWLPCSIV